MGLLMIHPSARTVLVCACIVSTVSVVLTFAQPQQQPGQVAPGQLRPPAPSASTNTPATQDAGPPANQLPLEFESHGMEYEALTRNGITVMFAPLPPHIKDFNVVQITITNGSLISWTVKPADFSFVRQDGTVLPSVSADDVVESLLEKASRTDVVKLQLLYESTIYALSNYRPTNGYEQRREAAMGQFINPRIKAAAAASAITFVPMKLKPGGSTDGAIFFENHTREKALGPGRLIAHTCGETFSFQVYSEPKIHQ
ncbi:MAG: hypothetical protein M3Y57_14870 [Acidobacteriota bacterium]|nr:hypothetical protein [Acidobacteriota bacterium]